MFSFLDWLQSKWFWLKRARLKTSQLEFYLAVIQTYRTVYDHKTKSRKWDFIKDGPAVFNDKGHDVALLGYYTNFIMPEKIEDVTWEDTVRLHLVHAPHRLSLVENIIPLMGMIPTAVTIGFQVKGYTDKEQPSNKKINLPQPTITLLDDELVNWYMGENTTLKIIANAMLAHELGHIVHKHTSNHELQGNDFNLNILENYEIEADEYAKESGNWLGIVIFLMYAYYSISKMSWTPEWKQSILEHIFTRLYSSIKDVLPDKQWLKNHMTNIVEIVEIQRNTSTDYLEASNEKESLIYLLLATMPSLVIRTIMFRDKWKSHNRLIAVEVANAKLENTKLEDSEEYQRLVKIRDIQKAMYEETTKWCSEDVKDIITSQATQLIN